MTDRERKAMVLQSLAELYGKDMGGPGGRLYMAILDDYAVEDVVEAGKRIAKECSFFPAPAEFVKRIEGSPEEKSLVAFERAIKAVGTYGCYMSVDFQDPATHYAIASMGGWQAFCMRDAEKRSFTEREFRMLYGAYRGYGAPAYLAGGHELEGGSLEECRIPKIVGSRGRRMIEGGAE